jgi:hypothetical protein
MKSKKDLIRERAEQDLAAFIKLVHPKRVLGEIHFQVINWWTRKDAKSHQLLLLPRDHQKSALVAYRVAWAITRNPSLRILYISSTSNLAEKQLKFIKDILTSDKYREYWPEMVNLEESRREKWTETEISVDHPKRKEEFIREPTIFTAGLTTVITGLHCDIAVLDDVVVRENGRTEMGREKVDQQYAALASIETTDSLEWVVGTRYHSKDLYGGMATAKFEVFNEEGEPIGEPENLYEIFERQVEDKGDGTGTYIWPRQKREDGRWFGFNQKILAKKKAQYRNDMSNFRAQYYNDPNDPEAAGITRDCFLYYDKNLLAFQNGYWAIKGRKLNVFASADFAYSLERKADFTAIVIVGVDFQNNYYILDIDRFKSGLPSEYFEHILKLHQKWGFRKIRAEVTAAQITIVNTIKQDYIRPYGLALVIDEYRPNRSEGNKAERVFATLEPRYKNKQIWHPLGMMNCEALEEELLMQYPPHDDIKDALDSVINVCQAPTGSAKKESQNNVVKFTHPRFGGVAF